MPGWLRLLYVSVICAAAGLCVGLSGCNKEAEKKTSGSTTTTTTGGKGGETAANPKVTFVGVAARSEVAAMQGFVSKYNLNFTNLNDADGSIWARYNVPWQPAYVFYRADGSSTFVNNPTAAMPEQELSDRVGALS